VTALATVTPLPNGPLKVEGARVVSPEGTEISNKDPIFLCRCGHSDNKPFCDGHHAKVAFKT
jgi:CDGSH-type Zn-finger protein